MNSDNFRDISIAILCWLTTAINLSSKVCLATILRKKSSNQQTALPTAEDSAKDLQAVKFIGLFGALPDSEQADTTQRLDKLGQTLVIAHSRKAPLIIWSYYVLRIAAVNSSSKLLRLPELQIAQNTDHH